MSNFVRVSIVCPCGRLLETRSSNAESKSTTRGTKQCPACKRKVQYAVVGANAYTNYA